jgi:hypothetical protein
LTGSKVRPGSKDYLLVSAFHLLGKIPDNAVAERCGVSCRTVASYRSRHGIEGYTGVRKKKSQSQTPSKPCNVVAIKSRLRVSYAWLVKFAEVERVIEGENIAEVVATATGLDFGEVVYISRVGEMSGRTTLMNEEQA